MKDRRGFSLIELVAVLTTGALLLGIAVALLHSLMAAGRATRDDLRRQATLNRLADTFRDDVHAAVGLTDPDQNGEAKSPGRQLELGDGRVVRWQVEKGQLVRTLRVDGAVRRREPFVLLAHVKASIELDADGEAELVSLVIVPEDEQPGKRQLKPLRIDAVLGRDRRFDGS